MSDISIYKGKIKFEGEPLKCGNPACECDKAMYIDFLEEGVCAIKEQLKGFQRALDKELSR